MIRPIRPVVCAGSDLYRLFLERDLSFPTEKTSCKLVGSEKSSSPKSWVGDWEVRRLSRLQSVRARSPETFSDTKAQTENIPPVPFPATPKWLIPFLVSLCEGAFQDYRRKWQPKTSQGAVLPKVPSQMLHPAVQNQSGAVPDPNSIMWLGSICLLTLCENHWTDPRTSCENYMGACFLWGAGYPLGLKGAKRTSTDFVPPI